MPEVLEALQRSRQPSVPPQGPLLPPPASLMPPVATQPPQQQPEPSQQQQLQNPQQHSAGSARRRQWQEALSAPPPAPLDSTLPRDQLQAPPAPQPGSDTMAPPALVSQRPAMTRAQSAADSPNAPSAATAAATAALPSPAASDSADAAAGQMPPHWDMFYTVSPEQSPDRAAATASGIASHSQWSELQRRTSAAAPGAAAGQAGGSPRRAAAAAAASKEAPPRVIVTPSPAAEPLSDIVCPITHVRASSSF